MYLLIHLQLLQINVVGDVLVILLHYEILNKQPLMKSAPHISTCSESARFVQVSGRAHSSQRDTSSLALFPAAYTIRNYYQPSHNFRISLPLDRVP